MLIAFQLIINCTESDVIVFILAIFFTESTLENIYQQVKIIPDSKKGDVFVSLMNAEKYKVLLAENIETMTGNIYVYGKHFFVYIFNSQPCSLILQ